MFSNETAKTKSALKRIIWLLPVGFFLLCCIYLGVMLAFGKKDDNNLHGKQYTLTAGKQVYRLVSVSSNASQEQGLSGTTSLPADKGMLFIDEGVAERCFWMKDMHYPLDIIWADASKRVTHIEKDLSPNTYPKAFCAAAQYVIELNAGQATKSGLSIGQVLKF